jgi:hypothetical protein
VGEVDEGRGRYLFPESGARVFFHPISQYLRILYCFQKLLSNRVKAHNTVQRAEELNSTSPEASRSSSLQYK